MQPHLVTDENRCRDLQLSTEPSFQSPVEEREEQLYEGDDTYSQVYKIIRESSVKMIM